MDELTRIHDRFHENYDNPNDVPIPVAQYIAALERLHNIAPSDPELVDLDMCHYEGEFDSSNLYGEVSNALDLQPLSMTMLNSDMDDTHLRAVGIVQAILETQRQGSAKIKQIQEQTEKKQQALSGILDLAKSLGFYWIGFRR